MNTPKKLLCYLCLLFGLSAILCSCSSTQQISETTISKTAENRLYVYAVHGKWGVLNAEGEFIITPQPNKLNLIQDRFSGEPRYIAMLKPIPGEKIQYTIDESNDAYSYYDNNRFLFDIYDTAGNLCYQDQTAGSLWAIGHYLILHQPDDNGFTIIDRSTETSFFMNADQIDFADPYLIFTWEQNPEGRYENLNLPCTRFYHSHDMSFSRDLPGYYFRSTFEYDGKHYFALKNTDGLLGLWLWEDDFTQVLPEQYTYFEEIHNGFLVAENAQHQDMVIELATGETVVAPEEDRDIFLHDFSFVNLLEQLHYNYV